MKFNPSEVFAKLQDMGIAIDTSDPLTKKIREVRERRFSKINPVECGNKVDYTPSIEGKGRPLHEIPKCYIGDVLNFVGYLESTKLRSFCIKMKNKLTGERFDVWKPYVHRWTEIYRKGILAKFYALEAYLGSDVSDVIMITLTTSSRFKTYEQAMSELKVGRKKILDDLRWKYGTRDYFWFFEYHKSGFSHLHIAYFHTIPLSDQVWLKRLWSEKYGYGNFEKGLNFLLPKASSDGSVPVGIIGNIRKYLTKYISKGLHPRSGSEPRQEVFLCGKKVPLDMSLAELLFNAILKKTKTRLWGCSRNFSKVMKKPENEHSDEFECIEVDQYFGLPVEDKELYPDETEHEKEKHFFSVLWTKEKLRPLSSQVVRQITRIAWEPVFSQSWSIPGFSNRPGYKVVFDKKTQLFTLYCRGPRESVWGGAIP